MRPLTSTTTAAGSHIAVRREPSDTDLQYVSDNLWQMVGVNETFPQARGAWRAVVACCADFPGHFIAAPSEPTAEMQRAAVEAIHAFATDADRGFHGYHGAWGDEAMRVYSERFTVGYRAALAIASSSAVTAPAAVEFTKWAIRESAFVGSDLPGGEVQEKAVELGLLVETVYDPDKHGPSDFGEPGMPWFEFAPTLSAPVPPSDAPARMREALEDAAAWHDAQDKAISKQPNANVGHNGWMRSEHQEQATLLRRALMRPDTRGAEAEA